MQEMVAQYLAHEGYTETAKAFGSEARDMMQKIDPSAGSGSQLDYKEDPDAINRQRAYSSMKRLLQ